MPIIDDNVPRDNALGQFPWYDAWWLTRFVLAKQYIARHAPGQLDAFVKAMAPLRTRPDFQAQLLDRPFNSEQLSTIRAAVETIRPAMLEAHELTRHGRFVVHDHPMLVELHAAMAPLVSGLVGESVEPLYSFIALYNANGECPVHLDAPVSKWTLDLCIRQSETWPIAFSEVVTWPEDLDMEWEHWEDRIRLHSGHRFSSISMEPGQAVVFSGSSQWHYRERFRNTDARDAHCDLLFMHFITAGMKEISEWTHWERLFCVPGLSDAIRHVRD